MGPMQAKQIKLDRRLGTSQVSQAAKVVQSPRLVSKCICIQLTSRMKIYMEFN